MTTALIPDNNLVNRRYARDTGRNWYALYPKIVEMPQQQTFFNVFSSQVKQSALLSFNEQLQNNQDKIISFEDIIVSFSKMLNVLLEINASVIYTQITSMNSLVMKAETPKGNAYAEMFFDEITGWPDETVLNIFHDQQLQFNNSGSLDAMILAIKQYFETEENYFTILNQANSYDLSGTAVTTIDF